MNLKAAFLAMAAAGACLLVPACGGGSSSDPSGGCQAAGSIYSVVAPQLVVAQNGPVTFTLLGLDTATLGNQMPGISLITSSDLKLGNPVASLHTLNLGHANGQKTVSFAGLSAGSDFTLSTTFSAGIGADGRLNLVNSTTGATPAVAAFLRLPEVFGAQTLLFNAGVIQTGPDSMLIGFSPSGTTPGICGEFPVRIGVSNVSFFGRS
jgi:hypothetical protein